MSQLPGFVDPRFSDQCMSSQKSSLWPSAAPRAWFVKFSDFLLNLGFQCGRADTSLFYFRKNDIVIYLLLYVDDIIVTCKNPSILRKFIDRVNKEFVVKDFSRLNYFLGLEVTHSDSGLFSSQATYTHDILTRADLLDSKPVATPFSAGESLVSTGSLYLNLTLYRSLVGALQYLTITRPISPLPLIT